MCLGLGSCIEVTSVAVCRGAIPSGLTLARCCSKASVQPLEFVLCRYASTICVLCNLSEADIRPEALQDHVRSTAEVYFCPGEHPW